jgi:hypothetical protein
MGVRVLHSQGTREHDSIPRGAIIKADLGVTTMNKIMMVAAGSFPRIRLSLLGRFSTMQ